MRAGQLYEQKYIILRSVTVRRDLRCLSKGRKWPIGQVCNGNEYACTMFGNLAQCKFYEGDLVAASLRFQVHEVNGAMYEEIVANDLVSLNK